MKILIATDGSQFSRAAVETVGRMLNGVEEKTSVRIVSAFEPPLLAAAAAPYAFPAQYNSVMEKELREAAENSVSEAARQMRSMLPKLNGNLTTRVLCGQPAAQAIVEQAREWGADLIVVGSHGYGFWQRMLLGSVSNAVVHHAPCSVLVVREKERSVEKN
jgi:nucleotide-binding universal stress UspA family protein